MSSKQDQLLREIIDSLPPLRIFVAAGLMMRLAGAFVFQGPLAATEAPG
jgi:hypothetical protein